MKLKSLSNKDRYGNMFSVEFFEPDTSIPIIMAIPEPTYDHPGDPKGTDTVPAWLTPGEFVMNAEATRKYEPELKRMNNEGREMQEKQGGSIPTYADDGGIIQSVTDFFTMPTPPEGSGIKYRRHKDGSIGIWAGNTFRGYYKEPAKKESSFSERLGISYNAEGGGVPPMYAEMGKYVPSPIPEWLTPEVLNAMEQVESGGDVNAVSKKGAVGSMQIMPATAANPGYNTQALTVAEMRDRDASRRFAQQYLSGIAEANPDFSMEEVITAYHSGVGNVRKAKEGKEDLGPMGQSYFAKVNDALQAAKPTEVASSSSIFPSLISEAQAMSSSNVPSMEFIPPAGATGSGEYLPDARKQGEAMLFNESVPEHMRNRKMLGKKDYGADIIYNSLGTPQSVNPRRISEEKRQQIIDTYLRNNNKEMYDRQMAEFNQAVKQNEAHQEYLKDQNKIKETQAAAETESKLNDIDERIANADPNDTPLINALQEERNKIVNEQEQTNANPTNNNTSTEQNSVSIVTQVIGESENQAGGTTQPTDNMISDFLKSKGFTISENGDIVPIGEPDPVTKSLTDKAQNAIVAAFGDLFNPKELARMALIYTGSRLLGYSHHGSLAYGAKQYLKRVDAAQAARQKFITDEDNLETYTKESLKKYLETGDITVLEEKAGSGYVTRGVGDNIMHSQLGRLPTVKIDKDTYGVVFRGETYPMDHPLMKGKLSKVDPKLDDMSVVDEVFLNKFTSQVKNIKAINTFDEDELKRFDAEVGTVDLSRQATDLYAKDILLFARSPEAKRKIQTEVLKSQIDYLSDMAAHIKHGKPKPTSLDAYYHKRMVKVNTNKALPYEMIRTVNPQAFADLDRQIKESVFAEGGTPAQQARVYTQMWQKFVKTWKTKGKASKFNGLMASTNDVNPGHNDFSNWVAHIVFPERKPDGALSQNLDGKSAHIAAMELLK